MVHRWPLDRGELLDGLDTETPEIRERNMELFAVEQKPVYRRAGRIRDDQPVTERLKVARDPLALSARLKQNSGVSPLAEQGGEPLPAGGDPAVGDGSVARPDGQRTLSLVRINAEIRRGVASMSCGRESGREIVVGRDLRRRYRGGPAAAPHRVSGARRQSEFPATQVCVLTSCQFVEFAAFLLCNCGSERRRIGSA